MSRFAPSSPPEMDRGTLIWRDGAPMVQMADAVVETVTTRIVRTTTSYKPLPLPRIPYPETLGLPHHLEADEYPLARAPNPNDAPSFSVDLGGQRALVHDQFAPAQAVRGWQRTTAETSSGDLLDALRGSRRRVGVATPPGTEDRVRIRSPPRKRARVDEDELPSPLPSPDHAPIRRRLLTPPLGSGEEMAALFSLPSLISSFEILPDKIQQHVLSHLLRRSRLPTLQHVANFAGSALKRDFVSFLPQEIALQVLRRVDARTLARATCVNKTWQRLIDGNRSVWMQRLVDDDLYMGLGIEEEDERTLRRRMDVLDRNGPRRWPVPLKHVYRRRYLSNKGWLKTKPKRSSFLGQSTSVVTCAQFDRDRVITASDDHGIDVYDIRHGRLITRLAGHDGGVWALEYKAGYLVTGSTDKTLRIWDMEQYRQAHVFPGHTSTVRCLKIVEPLWDEKDQCFYPPCPIVVSGARDSVLRVWRLPQKGEACFKYKNAENETQWPEPKDNPYHLKKLEGHSQAVRDLATHGRLCLSASYDHTIRVWDLMDGECTRTLTGHSDKVYSVVYDRYRHRCISGSSDNSVRVWDLATGDCLAVLMGHTSLVGLLELSTHCFISAGADSCLRVWDCDTLDVRQTIDAQGGAVTCFAHDETKIISGSEGVLRLTDSQTGRAVCNLVQGISSVWQVIMRDNLLVAATSRNDSTQIEVFDFGRLSDASGIDDDTLDIEHTTAWQRFPKLELPRGWYPSHATRIVPRGATYVDERLQRKLDERAKAAMRNASGGRPTRSGPAAATRSQAHAQAQARQSHAGPSTPRRRYGLPTSGAGPSTWASPLAHVSGWGSGQGSGSGFGSGSGWATGTGSGSGSGSGSNPAPARRPRARMQLQSFLPDFEITADDDEMEDEDESEEEEEEAAWPYVPPKMKAGRMWRPPMAQEQDVELEEEEEEEEEEEPLEGPELFVPGVRGGDGADGSGQWDVDVEGEDEDDLEYE